MFHVHFPSFTAKGDMMSRNSYSFMLLLTLTLTIACTSTLLVAYLSSHWDEIYYDVDDLTRIVEVSNQNETRLTMYQLQEGVFMMEKSENPPKIFFLVPVSGGVWDICESVSGNFYSIINIILVKC